MINVWMEKAITLTAKLVGSPADGYTSLWTGLCISRNDVTETRTVAHWRTRACCLHAHLYIWLCINLEAHRNSLREYCILCHGISSVSVITLTWLLHSLKRGPVITWHDCSTVTNLIMLSLQGAVIYRYKSNQCIYIFHNINMKWCIHDGSHWFLIMSVWYTNSLCTD